MSDDNRQATLPIPSGRRSVRIACPTCDGDRPTLAVYADGTHCFRCGLREDVEQFVSRGGLELLRRADSYLPAGSRRGVPARRGATVDGRATGVLVEVWSRTLVRGPRRDRLSYLTDRGIWLQTIVRHKLGHTGERFVIPLRVSSTSRQSAYNNLVGYKLRSDPKYCDPDAVKYLQFSDPKTVIYRPNEGGDPVIFCEGEFDALVLSQLGADAITSTGGAGSLAKTCGYLRFPARQSVYLATDQDDAGEAAACELLTRYPTALRLRWSNGNDVSEALMNGSAADSLQRWVRQAELSRGVTAATAN